MMSHIMRVVLHLCGQGNLITTVWKVREFLLSNRVGTLCSYKEKKYFRKYTYGIFLKVNNMIVHVLYYFTMAMGVCWFKSTFFRTVATLNFVLHSGLQFRIYSVFS